MPKVEKGPAHRLSVSTASAAGGTRSSSWSAKDDETLIQARAQGLNWNQIGPKHFPSKTPNACRKRHERLMERQNAEQWDGVKLDVLAQAYMEVRREMWSMLAARVGEKWQLVETKCMEKGLKNLTQAYRSAQKKLENDVDSFHPKAHPQLPTIELHGYLRNLVCLTCRNEYSRRSFQNQLSTLNPSWATFLAEMIESGALDTENPDERRKKGLKSNPDGDVDVPDAPYTTFRYPACPTCLEKPPKRADGGTVRVQVDKDGAWDPASEGGVLKPAVIMFGESIPAATKVAAEEAVDAAGRILVIGSSLATYSAWRLVKKAKEMQMPIGVLNMGGVRGEETFFGDVEDTNTGREAARLSENAEKVLPQVVKILQEMKEKRQ
ncbi:uncharacterized protein ALTATR162_LOCUS8594 [Alternaria atra]|uniref:Deacetylase sirtuin-type domain-containing protein n=1 Tax=Alternaria atra TaxID=119953 RepID=A0A8J2ICW5_9PLEO|nr:uncharacterized protein ALTATR162_LOCUS8594 [Alternaria atra]CAG5178226.1 unnamed protein product [Alternaria atra]